MGELEDRDQWEMRFSRALSRYWRGWTDEIVSMLGDPPSWGNIVPELWNRFTVGLQRVLQPLFGDLYNQTATRLIGDMPVGIDPAVIQVRAATWAQNYTFELVQGITKTTREALQRILSRGIESGLTTDDMRRLIQPLFGPVRAELIAITETTRAAVEGEIAAIEELRAAGLVIDEYWLTAGDDRVCPICGPLDNKKRGDGWTQPPPAHPRCRCGIEGRVVTEEQESNG